MTFVWQSALIAQAISAPAATAKPWLYYAQQGAKMPGYLRQSTASQSRAIGPFIDDTDFKTAETALTINNTDIKLVVNGGASANKNSGGGTHRANGVYGITFDATDTATVGEIEVNVVVAGALPVFDKFFVLEEAVYDSLFAASAPGPSTITTAQVNTEVDTALTDYAAATLEGSLTRDQAQRIILSGIAGKVSGAATTTNTFRDTADSKNRIVSTVDSDGNRTAVTLDGA